MQKIKDNRLKNIYKARNIVKKAFEKKALSKKDHDFVQMELVLAEIRINAITTTRNKYTTIKEAADKATRVLLYALR